MGEALTAVIQYVDQYLAKNGGPIIITQIENEYGGAGNDPNKIAYYNYMIQLKHSLNTGTVWIMCSGGDGNNEFISTCNGGGCDGFVAGQQEVGVPGR